MVARPAAPANNPVTMPVYRKRSLLDAPVREVFDWHERPGAFERLVPPWNEAELLEAPRSLRDGERAVLLLTRPPIRLRWVARHYGYDPPHAFHDEQTEGPFTLWRHAHKFLDEGKRRCVLEDEIEYRLPVGILGQIFGGWAAKSQLERIFRFRHARTAADLKRHGQFRDNQTMRVAITGAGGLVGRELAAFLTSGGHEVIRLVRAKADIAPDQAHWSPSTGEIAAQALEGLDAVVHLAGENIASGRWNPERKRKIHASRVDGTSLLARTLAGLKVKPKTLISASAIGYYGNRGNTVTDEDSEHGAGFLSDVCRAWEAAAEPAAAAGIRVVNLRIGVVLSARGGALAKMRTPFKFGVGGVVGNGEQFMSWIMLDDLVGAIHFALQNTALEGAVNATAPAPVNNREFTKTLGAVLGRPTLLPLPTAAVRVLFGEMGEELLLSGAQVLPHKLTEAGFSFEHPDLKNALATEFGKG